MNLNFYHLLRPEEGVMRVQLPHFCLSGLREGEVKSEDRIGIAAENTKKSEVLFPQTFFLGYTYVISFPTPPGTAVAPVRIVKGAASPYLTFCLCSFKRLHHFLLPSWRLEKP